MFTDFTWNFQTVVGEIVGIAAFIITFFVYQAKTAAKVQILLIASASCLVVSYLLLGAASGWILNIVCIVRTICYYFHEKPILSWRGVPYVFAVIVFGTGLTMSLLSHEGPIALLIIVPLTVNTVMVGRGNIQHLRISILFTSTAVLIYNIYVLSVGGMLNEIVAIVSSVIGIFRFRESKKSETISEYEQVVNKS